MIQDQKNQIAVLFVRLDSIYKDFNVCDCYDLERNALTFNDNRVIIAHPPCRLWGRLYKQSTAPPEEKQTAIFSINKIRQNGGVLEHPAGSKLWQTMELPTDSKTDKYGGFTISVNQHWFGHRAEKRTWLYICGIDRKDLPVIPVNFNAVTHVITKCRKHANYKKEVSRKERESTPKEFASWLINLCLIIDKNKVNGK